MTSVSALPHHTDVVSETMAVAAAIAIPAHIVQSKGHGHAGTAMALAPLAHVLFSRVMRHSPANPLWPARDRFVLSAGHASLLLYTQLFLTGYGLTIDDIAASRKLGSRTPGHPEFGHTSGVEMTTGPLGQGVASAIGMAIASRHESATLDAGSPLIEPTVWVVAGDGCLQEGVSSEASSLAGTLGLDNLVLVWDDNGITIDGPTTAAFTEDVRARYRAYGWRVLSIADHTDLGEIERVLRDAGNRTAAAGRPTLVALSSVIGAPSVVFGGQATAHSGGFGAEELAAVKQILGFSPDATLEQLVAPEALTFCRRAIARGHSLEVEWADAFALWAAAEPESAKRWLAAHSEIDIAPALDALTELAGGLPEPGIAIATRKTNGHVLTRLHSVLQLWGGSADLAGSTNVGVPGQAFTAGNPAGEFIRFGIREHAMAAILNGIALHGIWRPFGSTYLVFSDYMRPAMRLAALMKLPVLYVFTHDSVAVGEDGPTHQPVEQIASLRTVPGLSVVRPADAAETVAAWRRLIARPDGPVALILSRQDVPVLAPRPGLDRGVSNGGYVAWQHGGGLDVALIATGSEVAMAIEAAEQLAAEGISARVVSLPCVEWFADSGQAYMDGVLPPAVIARVAIEAGRGDAWWRWVGTGGEVIGVEHFGESGSGPEVMSLRGITTRNIVAAAKRSAEVAAGDRL
jgi:transketolase